MPRSTPRAGDQRRGAFVWVWLPGATEPVVAGRVQAAGTATYAFVYARSYLARPNRIPLYLPELPLTDEPQLPTGPLGIAGCLRDASPDAWGRRVILARRFGHLDEESDTGDLDELTYMLESGSDRIGGLDFQASATEYVPREETATLPELLEAAERLEAGRPLPPAVAEALIRGSSIGGARPKVTLRPDLGTGLPGDGVGAAHGPDGRHLIAKLSSKTDLYPVVKAEAVAMVLARRVGLDVAHAWVASTAGRDVLLVERFDRTPVPGQRRLMVSALTILGFGEMESHHASYVDLADGIRARFAAPKTTLRELYTRMVFNVCVGNTDDHLRNHAAFWDGSALTLTPAYDLCPQLRSGEIASQAINLTRVPGERASQLRLCRKAAADFLLDASEAEGLIDRVVTTIEREWPDAADEAALSAAERNQLWRRQILNPYLHYDQP